MSQFYGIHIKISSSKNTKNIFQKKKKRKLWLHSCSVFFTMIFANISILYFAIWQIILLFHVLAMHNSSSLLPEKNCWKDFVWILFFIHKLFIYNSQILQVRYFPLNQPFLGRLAMIHDQFVHLCFSEVFWLEKKNRFIRFTVSQVFQIKALARVGYLWPRA